MRIALGLEYDGTRYFGFQRQDVLPTVQSALESAITKIADHPVTVVCAGRTDRGVHAKCQVVHFDTTAIRPDIAWTMGVNTQLPSDIAIQWACIVPDDFHSRYKATSRRYQYRLYNTRIRSALLSPYATWYPVPLNADLMHEAAQLLLGKHDFSAFRASECQAKTPIKTIEWANITRENDMITLDIKADAFLHHMVRNIMGTLIKVGAGHRPVSWVTDVLESRERAMAGIKAEPQGLILIEISYPTHYNLPMVNEDSV